MKCSDSLNHTRTQELKNLTARLDLTTSQQNAFNQIMNLERKNKGSNGRIIIKVILIAFNPSNYRTSIKHCGYISKMNLKSNSLIRFEDV